MTGSGSILAACAFAGPAAMLTIVGKNSSASTGRCELAKGPDNRIVQRRPTTYTVDRGLFGKVVLIDACQPHAETVA
jgi:hypothetical protein